MLFTGRNLSPTWEGGRHFFLVFANREKENDMNCGGLKQTDRNSVKLKFR